MTIISANSPRSGFTYGPIVTVMLGCCRVTEAPMSSTSYSPLYTESSWMTLNVPVAALGGTIPSDLVLSASGLPDGTSITLVGVSQEGDQAVLTVSVQRTNTDNFINATSLIKLTSGDTTLTSFNVPVVGTAYTSSGS